ncbi:MAG: electron transfer flavoprotein subunit alpha/FixB family protein [Acidimicrobiia bacterium]|nr:electron transfer flavoprotein subunit alpha/FixB family protein [Acidimicrobiia bacterium]
MSNNVLVLTEHLQGTFTDATFEALAMARRLANSLGGEVEAAVAGLGSLASALGGADTVLVVEDPMLESFNPEAHARVFSTLVADREPVVVLVPYTSMGMDVASAVAVGCGLPLVSYCTDVRADGGLAATCRLYAGKIEATVEVSGGRAVFALLSGSVPAAAGHSGGAGKVVSVSPPDLSDLHTRFERLIEPTAGDVDITSQDVLVVVGRGIESKDNIAQAEALAAALGGAVACSRPIVDQGWLPKTRQVGKSGLAVKPKIYLALGVSGAPEHLEGMRGASTIIAINTDPKAPIFGVAHYGWVGDLFDLLPELMERLGS